MNILLADSGATKTDWHLISDTGKETGLQTPGCHPLYTEEKTLGWMIKERVLSSVPAPDVVYFYGAGCHGEETCRRVQTSLSSAFGEIPIHVESDMLGAARALCGREPGIACILGTGSNSCQYDGVSITRQIPALGYILGDEGSAAHLGRMVLQAYFYEELPEEASRYLEKHHSMQKAHIIKEVYEKTRNSRFIASFSQLFSEFPDHPSLNRLLDRSFTEFIERHVLKYDLADTTPVHFTGSVAWHHRGRLSLLLQNRNRVPGRFLRSPMPGLIKWHQKPRL